jgi:CRISPR-associated protein (TIGR03984 family)
MTHHIKVTRRTTITWNVADLPDPAAWLAGNAFTDRLLLLGHADDGVIWGRLEHGRLTTADAEFPQRGLASLQPTTLQLCRLFGEDGELMLWRADQGWAARCWQDGQGEEATEYFDEDQVLWGTQIEASADRFTLVSDGVSGLIHAIPLNASELIFDAPPVAQKQRPLRLTLRHYLAENQADGTVHISGSRLVRLGVSYAAGMKEAGR